MASKAIPLLKVVALSLPAVAILMRAILHIQADDADQEIRLYSEFRFLELSFVLLVLSAGALAFQIALTARSLFLFVGLITMVIGFLFVVPATFFGLRRGMTDVTPERAIMSTLAERKGLAGASSVVILAGTVVLVLVFWVPVSLPIVQFLAIAVGAITIASATIAYTNRLVERRAREREHRRWTDELEAVTDELLAHIETWDDHGEALLYSTEFRGPLFRMVDDIIDLLETAPADVDVEGVELEPILQDRDIIREMATDRLRAESYIDQAESELQTMRSDMEDVERRIAEIEGEIDEEGANERRETLRELREEREQLQGEIDRLVNHLEQARATRREAVEEAEATIRNIEDNVRALRSELL